VGYHLPHLVRVGRILRMLVNQIVLFIHSASTEQTALATSSDYQVAEESRDWVTPKTEKSRTAKVSKQRPACSKQRAQKQTVAPLKTSWAKQELLRNAATYANEEGSDWRIKELGLAERVQETEQRPDVHGAGKAITIVKMRKTSERGAAPSIIEDPAVILLSSW